MISHPHVDLLAAWHILVGNAGVKEGELNGVFVGYIVLSVRLRGGGLDDIGLEDN
jgi:hypothetical protein